MSHDLKLENFLPYRLAVLSNTVSTTVARAYDKRFNVSIPEWRVIAILGRFPGLSAVEVAERTMLDKVAVSRAVTKLIKKGRVDREDELGRDRHRARVRRRTSRFLRRGFAGPGFSRRRGQRFRERRFRRSRG